MDERDEQGREDRLATLGERVLAFSLDGLPFLVGFRLGFWPLFGEGAAAGQYAIWTAIWLAMFLLYHAYTSCEGRVSPGKRLLGIKVVSVEREDLSLGQAIIRSATYLVSSVLGLGFLWSLFSPSRQCWHDMAAGSVVVGARPKGAGSLVFARVGGLACLALLGGLMLWDGAIESRYRRIMLVAHAQLGLSEMRTLQEIHRIKKGRYADNVLELAEVSVSPGLFMRSMARRLDLGAGIDIKTTKKGYTIFARARDPQRTRVKLSGPTVG